MERASFPTGRIPPPFPSLQRVGSPYSSDGGHGDFGSRTFSHAGFWVALNGRERKSLGSAFSYNLGSIFSDISLGCFRDVPPHFNIGLSVLEAGLRKYAQQWYAARCLHCRHTRGSGRGGTIPSFQYSIRTYRGASIYSTRWRPADIDGYMS